MRFNDQGSNVCSFDLPLDAKEQWDPDFAKRKAIQAELIQRLPGFSIKMGGTTSIDVTREGVDKAYGLERLSCESGIPLDAMLFVGDAIFPGGNDYPAKLLGLDTICVRDPREALSVIAVIVACLADRHAFPEGITPRSEEHTSELQSLMRISYAVFCLKKKNNITYKEENT